MQHYTFTNGGFVLHRVEGKFSCWYDKDGKMLDCEVAHGPRYAVKHGGPIWRRLESLGRVYRERAA